MKYFNLHGPSKLKAFGLIAAGLMLGFSSISAWAAPVGTPVGTSVSNLATLSYSVGAVAQTAIGSSTTGNSAGAGTATTFLVDAKINPLVTGPGTFTSVVPGATAQASTFTVTNNGNSPIDLSLTTANLANGTILFAPNGTDNFDATSCSTFLDTNGNGVYNPGTDLAATYVDELISGNSATVFVVCTIPAGQVNGDNAVVNLIATAQGTFTATGYTATPGSLGPTLTATVGANTANVDVVFADAAGTDDGANDAKSSARSQYRVVTATLAVSKIVTPICDPANGGSNPKNIPGGAVQYAITVANTGASPATLTSLADTLVSQLAFDTKLNSGTGGAAACIPGGGTSLSPTTGFAAVTGAGVGPGVVAPGVAANATTAGASIAGQVITITFNALATSAITAPAAATLAAGSYITVYFNAFIQ